jgi:hypothetical protein
VNELKTAAVQQHLHEKISEQSVVNIEMPQTS